MLESISTAAAITLLKKSAHIWLPFINEAIITPAREALVGKLTEKALEKGIAIGHNRSGRDEKEQIHQLELALKNAAERGLAQFPNTEDQQRYNEVLSILSTADANTLRREALRLFTLDVPDLTRLNTLYNTVLREHSQGQTATEVDAIPYLSSFFDALQAELYINSLFHDRVSDAIRVSGTMSMQRSLTEVLSTLNQIGGMLADNYTSEQFEKDVQAYTVHIERTLRYLKLVGIVPKGRAYDNTDPRLDDIFVQLRIAPREHLTFDDSGYAIADMLAQSPCVVLLGGPGYGKSTATKHLAWSHAAANLSNSTSLTDAPLLAGNPLPLRIELRRLNEDRKQHPEYDFLSYASEVLLRGLAISPQMFKELLERRAMVILFDGLDEVATQSDRRILVEEIESFVQQYPGNRFVVTSRPVGYELAPLSNQLFSDFVVLPFNDKQIGEFLEKWYSHVLRLSPLSPDDAKELAELKDALALEKNARLHDLAEIPLLLTVITALHRYERLPDIRIRVYDRCADLLLETWARLKGTNARWNDLELIKEEQEACIAHLGFVLHKRAQEQPKEDTSIALADISLIPVESTTDVDVPLDFMRREIERYLQHQQLFSSRAKQQKQAEIFLDLIQKEAGLIVERGKDGEGNDRFGFIHTTFQEYFAAVDVYKRYTGKGKPAIISKFLIEYLHDPHWREVMLLLFGKLGREQSTMQLSRMLEGKLKSRRSNYTEIIQQDLFFISDCLIDGIRVTNPLEVAVVGRLSKLITHSPYLPQAKEALTKLHNLIQIRQHSMPAQQELRRLITQNAITSIQVKVLTARALLEYSEEDSEAWQSAAQSLLIIAQHAELSNEFISLFISEIWTFYQSNPKSGATRQFTSDVLQPFTHRDDLPIDAIISALSGIFAIFPGDASLSLEAQTFISYLLTSLANRPGLSIEQKISIAKAFDQYRLTGSAEWQHTIIQELSEQLKRPELPNEQFISIAQWLTSISYLLISPLKEAENNQWVTTSLFHTMAQQPDISTERSLLATKYLYLSNSAGSEAREAAFQTLLDFTRRPDLPVEYYIQVINDIDLSFDLSDALSASPITSPTNFRVPLFLSLAQRPGLPAEQAIQVAQHLFSLTYSFPESEEFQRAHQVLRELAQRSDLPVLQFVEAMSKMLLDPFLRIDSILSDNNPRDFIVSLLFDLVKHIDSSDEDYISLLCNLYLASDSGAEARQFASQTLISMSQDSSIPTIEPFLRSAQRIYQSGFWNNEEQQFAIRLLLDMYQHPGLPIQKKILLLQSLYRFSLDTSVEPGFSEFVNHELKLLVRQPDLPIEAFILVIKTLYMPIQSDWLPTSFNNIAPNNIAQQFIAKLLVDLQQIQSQRMTIEQRLEAGAEILAMDYANYSERLQATLLALNLLEGDSAKQFFETHWKTFYYSPYYSPKPEVADIPLLAQLAQVEVLPARVRDDLFQALRSMVSQFDQLPEPAD